MLKRLEVIKDSEMTDEEVWWYCWGKLTEEELSPEIKNRFDKLVRACDWKED